MASQVFAIPFQKITCRALKPPSAPAGLFVLLGLTALVQPSTGGRVTLLTDLCQIDHGDEGRDKRTTLKSGR